MARRKRRLTTHEVKHVDPSASWTRADTTRVHGRILTAGSEVSIRGERGRHRFLESVTTDAGVHWLWFMGPCGFRAFYPDRVRTVHRIAKTRENLKEAA